MSFNERDYTFDAIKEELILIEKHGKDGSAVQSGCECVEGKHLRAVEGLSKEGVGFGLSGTEKEYFGYLADLAREQRKKIENEDWTIPRQHNPHSFRSCEERQESCIRQVKKTCKPPACNPYAVCRASIPCPS